MDLSTRLESSQNSPTRRRRALMGLLALALACAVSVSSRAEDFEPPPEWLSGWLIFQNVMHNHQVLRVEPGTWYVTADWGQDRSHRFKLEATDTAGFFFLRNSLTGQRLCVYYDGGNGTCATSGDDEAFQWRIEATGSSYYLRNRLYADKRLHVGHDGDGQVYAEWGDDDAYRWTVEVIPWEGEDRFLLSYRPSSYYMGNDVLLISDSHSDRWLRVHYSLAGQPLADAGGTGDPAYHWKLENAPEDGFFFLRSVLNPSQRLHVGHNGNGELYVGCSDDDALKWAIEPTSGNAFELQNRLWVDQHLRVDGAGNLTAGPVSSDSRWRMVPTPPDNQGTCH